MSEIPRLDSYHEFFERDWETLQELRDAFEWEIPETFNIADYCLERWAENKSRVGLFYEDEDGHRETYTFWQLKNFANKLANYLKNQGIERGDRVGVIAPQRPESAISFIAIWKVGGVVVPLNTLFGPEALEYRLTSSRAKYCIAAGANIEAYRKIKGKVDTLQRTLVIGKTEPKEKESDFWQAIENCSRHFENVVTKAEDNAVLIYTSGTTGPPKGVLHAHRWMLGQIPQFNIGTANLEMLDSDVYWTPASWAWVAGFTDILMYAWYFGRPVLGYHSQGFDGEGVFELIERYGLSNMLIPPTGIRMMMQVDNPEEKYDLSSVRCLVSAGEATTNNIINWADDVFEGVPIHTGYGQTEANGSIGNCWKLFPVKKGKMGRRFPGHDVRILDPETHEPYEEPNKIGEIGIRYEGNPLLMKEYWENPEATGQKIQNGWLLTEDLAEVDEDGYFSFKSRKDDVIISSGYRIGPEEIENCLCDHPGVQAAGVIGIPHDVRGEIPKAFVQLSPEHDPSESLKKELQDFVKDRLAKYEYPRRVEFIEELPKTLTGKIQRRALRER